MATKAGNGILESEIVRGISIPLPEFQLEYAVEAELHIEFALMLPKKRGEPGAANRKVTKNIRL